MLIAEKPPVIVFGQSARRFFPFKVTAHNIYRALQNEFPRAMCLWVL